EDKIEQVVRLIRSKGVGVYFITQNPIDVPDKVLGQLGNRVQHALRAFTPRDEKAIAKSAETFRTNPQISVKDVITELGVGEALISLLDEKGAPGVVERALVVPPHSRIGPATPGERAETVQSSVLKGHYETAVDRESAYEILKVRAEEAAAAAEQAAEEAATAKAAKAAARPAPRQREGLPEAMAKSTMRAIGSQIGRQIARGILGSILGGRR
ncbi:MAG TPA: helicase HerA-like domain-containing protein, partial [Dehalococcoidia bacterium]|nr:helicase HerA-like domain-containing protein [Dehalococcoidia bacterium]